MDKILFCLAQKKGSGETVWEIKDKIGYFASYMLLRYDYLHTAEQMIIGGFFDSVGLYQVASDMQINLALQWLQLLNLQEQKHVAFRNLPPVQQRLIFTSTCNGKASPIINFR